ncbi:MAG: hypothetical protein QXV35_05375 [Archaeoglobaceae archaeon]
MIAPKWRFKVRILKSGCGGKEKAVKIPNPLADYFGAYVEMRFVDGKLVIEPYNEDSTPAGAESDNASSQEVS